ncbi:MAG: methionyl-tRNA formyltransferase [Mariprofundaceae bacterium]
MIRVVFAGTPGFSEPCLQALMQADGIEVVGVVSQPDRKAGRGMKLTPSAVKQTALDAGIDVITPEGLVTDGAAEASALAWLQDKQPDVLVVVAFGMLLPAPWLEVPKIAPLNVHASLLPRWRGAAPIERSLLAGDERTGVCIMRMEEGLDTGPVYARREIPITPTTLGSDLWFALAPLGAQLLLDTLPDIVAGNCQPEAQPQEGVTYAKKIRNEERIIDWQQPAEAIDRLVRCFSPRPGARTMLNGKWLKIIAGQPLSGKQSAKCGSIVHVADTLDVACGQGSIYRIRELQPEGKKPMTAADFLRGANLKPGDLLG